MKIRHVSSGLIVITTRTGKRYSVGEMIDGTISCEELEELP